MHEFKPKSLIQLPLADESCSLGLSMLAVPFPISRKLMRRYSPGRHLTRMMSKHLTTMRSHVKEVGIRKIIKNDNIYNCI